jgi:hypothetical protein
MTTPSTTAALASGTLPHRSRADVSTAVPGRYAKQLVSHLGRKVHFVEDQGTWTATVDGAVARLTVADSTLVLQAEAADVSSLARIEDALGRHLERFGQRSRLVVTWQRTSTAPA